MNEKYFFFVWRDIGVSPKGRISHLPEQSCWLYVLIAQKILSIGKLVELKMPDFCDCTRLGISILVSAADLSIKSIYRSRFGLNFSKHKKTEKICAYKEELFILGQHQYLVTYRKLYLTKHIAIL